VTAELLDFLKHAQRHLASGELEQAAWNCEQAIGLEPQNAEAQNLLGLIVARQGDYQRAVTHLRSAVDCQPDSPAFLNNLGFACYKTGQLDKARESFQAALALSPDFVKVYLNLGNVNRDLGDVNSAIDCYREAISRNPQFSAAHFALGDVLHTQGDLSAAANHYQQALVTSDDPQIRFRLAVTLDAMGHHQQAADLYTNIAVEQPDYPGLQNNLGSVMVSLGRADDAVECYRRAIALDPGNAAPHNNLGNALTSLWRPNDAIHSLRAALAIRPVYPKAHSNLLLNMNYVEESQEKIYAESLRFEEQQAQGLSGTQGYYTNSLAPEKKLRIGYVSADFRDHSVAYFALPLLEAHNREQFEIICYSSGLRIDEMTGRFRSLADRWMSIVGMTDNAAAEQIRRDEVDILVDLAGHTSNNRLLLFARKPAPIQVSWLGYPNTTGLRAIGYRMTDSVADPPGELDDLHTERLIRLPRGFLCYLNDPRSPPVSTLPSDRQGYVTFGSFNTLAKVTMTVIDTWVELLRSVPDARLVLKDQSLASDKTKAVCLERFTLRGISADRIQLLPLVHGKDHHLGLYGQIDIALDPFPYNGTTTTCEALWMGVPVVTLSGSRHAGRVSASILHQVGLTDLIATDCESYLSLAKSLAADSDGRRALRASLRERMRVSKLMDQAGFAAAMETEYRRLWVNWCGDAR
jgi:protein O-GlcNAc transferase